MANLNKVILIGRLTRDPETRFIPSGSGVTNFGLAINRVYNAGGEKREEVCFVDVTAWEKTGETIARYVKKGDPLLVEGRLKFDTWESQTGEKRSKLSVVVERFQFLGGGGGGEQSDNRRSSSSPTHHDVTPDDFGIETAPSGEPASEDVPF